MAIAGCICMEEMKSLVMKDRKTHKEISDILKERNPGVRGLSEISVRRFCNENGIRTRTILSREEVKKEVSKCVAQVGGNYGRKMVTGCLRSKNVLLSERIVGKTLRELCPSAQAKRSSTAGRSLNPKVYKADYFGHKMHVDQNEKLVMYGVTHVLARDGYSGMIVGSATMPIKNNLEIYKHMFRPTLEKHGLWDQLRVDGGLEFTLICFIQDMLRDFRFNTSRQPWIKTKSTDNNIIERIWVEVNSRVNYPIKAIMNELVQSDMIDMSNDATKFCVSWVLCSVSKYGLKVFVDSWNNHSIPRKGRPISLAERNNKAVNLPGNRIPTTEVAVDQQKQLGGRLKHFSPFGIDPLIGLEELKRQRETKFYERFSDEQIFTDVVNGGQLLKNAVLFFIRLSNVV